MGTEVNNQNVQQPKQDVVVSTTAKTTVDEDLKEELKEVLITSRTAKNSPQMVGSEDTMTSTKSIVETLTKVFPAGLSEGAVVDKLMTTYKIDKETAQACYKSALDEVSKKSKVSKLEIQNNADALTSENGKDGIDNLNAWGNYQKMMLDTKTEAPKDDKDNNSKKDDKLEMDMSSSTRGGD